MEMRKILIADGNEEVTAELCGMLRGRFHVRVCREGYQTLEQLRGFMPDVLVLDLMLPGLDGISLLHAAAAEGLSPTVLAMTSYSTNYVLEAVTRLGVSYVMLKPCAAEALAARIGDLAECTGPVAVSQPDIRSTVSNILLSLGLPTKLRGYGCTREAILCLMRSPGMSITKELYPMVAKLCDGNTAQVERAIRGAIQAAWSSRDERIWRRYFQPGQDGSIPRPSNAEFLLRIVDMLLLDREEQWAEAV